MKKKVISALLCVGMVLSVVGCGTTEQGSTEQKVSSEEKSSESAASEEIKADELAWLDRSSNLPLVKEGTDKSLTIAVRMRNESGDPEDTWAYQFMTEIMNMVDK